ncbi:MAG: zinc ribbon domain-containing protein [Ruminococcaceae bacterium]|nr:zinc ribbon domain-containing protein [Oscillospiraceae bacterium]
MFCKNCGTEINEDSKFCLNCGTNLMQDSVAKSNEEKESIVFECKGSLQGGGVGKIVLTNKCIIWTKSKGANFMMGGVLSLLTKGDTSVKFEQILKIDTYLFLGGGGLQVYTNLGKNFKFGFNLSKDRDRAMEYIRERIS